MGEGNNSHKVTISKDFYLGKYPVTQSQWEAVMGNNLSNFKGADRPVETVSWDDCQQLEQRREELPVGERSKGHMEGL